MSAIKNITFAFSDDLNIASFHSDDIAAQKVLEVVVPTLAGKTMSREVLETNVKQVVKEMAHSLPLDDPNCGAERLYVCNGVIQALAKQAQIIPNI